MLILISARKSIRRRERVLRNGRQSARWKQTEKKKERGKKSVAITTISESRRSKALADEFNEITSRYAFTSKQEEKCEM